MLKITLIALGTKMPSWVNEAVAEYSKRLQEFAQFSLIEIPLSKRGKTSDLARILEKESALLLSALPSQGRIIALDSRGESFSSENLALKLSQLQQYHSHFCLIIGGPEGLSSSVINKADERWSLSRLTLPHPLVRIFVLETIYRSLAIIHHHPYHK